MFARDALILRPGAHSAIEVLFVTTPAAAGAAVYPQLQLQLQPGTRHKLVERHLGATGEQALVSANVSIELGAGAQLEHYRVQHSGAHTLFADTLNATLATEARYIVRQVAIGASTARTSAQVQLAGRGASLDWQAIAVARGDQVIDLLLRVDHRAPGTRTEEVFRGIAEERSHVAFNAHVDICAQAPGSEARQSLRGLIEGPRAEIDLRPRLQINTDDVRAQHGATTGQLDENLLFYLLSRGLDGKTARALLKWAFLGDVLKAIDLPALRSAAEHAAADQLPDVSAMGALAGGALT
jgi:Fe-S cluster assembly protein SufD